MSEIGGMMGLLLGASVLTICEFIDYVAMVAYRRHQKQLVARKSLRREKSINGNDQQKSIDSVSDNVKYYS